MRQYHNLVTHVLNTGTRKPNRTGVDTISTFGYYYEHNMKDGFPLLTTKEVSWKNIVVELLWFLSGSDQSEFLERHGCKFWRPWYVKDPVTDQDTGRVLNSYGPAWRLFPVVDHGPPVYGGVPRNFDQIRWLLGELKRNPMSRRLVVSAWNPLEATNAKLPPCHAMFILNVQNGQTEADPKSLCLHLTQRSCDVFLGVPYNLASYGLLLSLISRYSGIEPGIFAHSLVDAHIYTKKEHEESSEFDHIPALMTQLRRMPRLLPRLHIDDSIRTLEDVEALLHPSVSTETLMSKFVLEGYDPYPAIKGVPAV